MLDGDDFVGALFDAKAASRAAYTEEFNRAQMFVLDPRAQAALTAMGNVMLRFGDRDRRRIKREIRKAMRRALAGDLTPRPDLAQLYGENPGDTSQFFDFNGSMIVKTTSAAGSKIGYRAVERRPDGWG